MAKTKSKKLPKDVLGFKLPKEWRKAGNRLIEQAQTPAGRQAIAGAVTAVAGAAITAATARAAEARQRPQQPANDSQQATSRTPDVQSVAEAVEQGLEAVIGKLFGKAR